jgi:hypothetical protein
LSITLPNLSALIVANFDVVSSTASVSFQNTGTWYDYLTGETITATGAVQSLPLQPGEYHVYVNKNIVNAVTTPVIDLTTPRHTLAASVYPNPVSATSMVEVEIPEAGNTKIILVNTEGQQAGIIFSGVLAKGKHRLPLNNKINNLAAGMYLVKVQSKNQTGLVKMMIP